MFITSGDKSQSQSHQNDKPFEKVKQIGAGPFQTKEKREREREREREKSECCFASLVFTYLF